MEVKHWLALGALLFCVALTPVDGNGSAAPAGASMLGNGQACVTVTTIFQAVGNGSNCVPDWYATVATPVPVSMGTNANVSQSSLNTLLTPEGSHSVPMWMGWLNVSAATGQPWLNSWNTKTGAVGTSAQSSSFCAATGGNTFHEGPGIGQLSDGDFIYTYCGYTAGQPQGTAFVSNTTGLTPGTTYGMSPLKIVTPTTDTPATVNGRADLFMNSAGISEPTTGIIPSLETGTSGFSTLICGQRKTGAGPDLSYNGSMMCVSAHAGANGVGHAWFDAGGPTTGGNGAACGSVTNCWDPTSAVANGYGGEYLAGVQVHTNAWNHYVVASSTAGAGSITWNWPTVASLPNSAATCTETFTSSATVATAATNIVNGFAAACPSLAANYTLALGPAGSTTCATPCLVLETASGVQSGLHLYWNHTPTITAQANVTIGAGVNDVTNGGLSNRFALGNLSNSGTGSSKLLFVWDIDNIPFNYLAGTNGSAITGVGMDFALAYVTRQESNGNYIFHNADNTATYTAVVNNVTDSSPGQPFGAPVTNGACANVSAFLVQNASSPSDTNITPFSCDFRLEGDASVTGSKWPVTVNNAATLDYAGNIWIVYQCSYATDTSTHLCVVEVSSTNHTTLYQDTIGGQLGLGPGNFNPGFDIHPGPSGNLYVTAVLGAGNEISGSVPCTNPSGCVLQWVLPFANISSPHGHWTAQSLPASYSCAGTARAQASSPVSSGDGFHVYEKVFCGAGASGSITVDAFDLYTP